MKFIPPRTARLGNAVCVLLALSVLAYASDKQAVTQPAPHKKFSSHVASKNVAASSKTSSKTSTKRLAHKGKPRKTSKSARRGQQKIDTQRAQEIQEALIRQHYLDGQASGVWDKQTESAMERFQSDNGWQTKTIPDARALIKLGLGPDHQHLLNPESAMTTQPQTPGTTPVSAHGDTEAHGHPQN